MATKRFCDVCGRECAAEGRLGGPFYPKAADGKTVKVDWQADDRDVCLYCAIDAFKKLDDRPAAQAGRGELGEHEPDYDYDFFDSGRV